MLHCSDEAVDASELRDVERASSSCACCGAKSANMALPVREKPRENEFNQMFLCMCTPELNNHDLHPTYPTFYFGKKCV